VRCMVEVSVVLTRLDGVACGEEVEMPDGLLIDDGWPCSL